MEAINAHNGWAMAVAGALIVMSGLSVLSFIISKLHWILGLLENKKTSPDLKGPSEHDAERASTPELDHDLSRVSQSVPQYQTLTADLGTGFKLQDLFAVFQAKDFPHPHLTIRSLKEEGFLLPAGDGLFSWKS